jgi:hypothetical protein
MLAKKLAHLDPETDPFHDFRNFLYYIFTEVLMFGEPDPIQYDIADYIQNATVGPDGKTRQQVQAMRGCGKSVIAAIYCCWLWYCNPTIRIVYVGSNQDLVDASAKLIKDLLDGSELLQNLRPQDQDGYSLHHGRKVKALGQPTNQVSKFDVRGAGPGRDPSFVARPVFGGWTGYHPDIFLCDDCEIPENSLTELKRKRLMAKLLEAESLVLEDGKILYMGTPQTEDSIYLKLHAQGYIIRRWPAELPDMRDEAQCANVSPYLMDRSEAEGPGHPSYPERFGVEILLEKQAKSRAYYNLQMLLNPNLLDEERYPLKLRNAIVFSTPMDMAPAQIVWGTTNRRDDIEHAGRAKDFWCGPGYVSDEWLPFTHKVLYIDPKGGGADSVGWVVTAFLNGMVFVLDAGELAAGTSGTSEAVMMKLSHTALKYEVKQVIVESNWGGSKDESTYAKLLAPVMARINGPTQIDVNHVSGQKEVRILDCLEPIFNCHRIIFSEQAAKCVALSSQIARITRSRGALQHDDIIDALYGAIAPFASMVVLDPQVKEQEHKKAQALAVAKEFDEWTRKNTSWLKTAPKGKPQHQSQRGRRWGNVGPRQRRW